MKKTILVTTSTFPRWENDTIPSFVYYLSKQFKKKFNVIVLAPHYPGSKVFELMEGIRVYRYRYFFPYFERLCYGSGILSNIKSNPLLIILIPFLVIFGLYSQYKVTKLENVDIVNAHWILPQGFFAVFLNKFLNKPITTTSHIGDLSYSNFFLIKFFLKYTIKGSTMVTANSSYTKQKIISIYPKDVKIITMGIDIKHFNVKKSNFLKKEYNVKGPIILFVGRLVEKKGIIYLVRSIPYLLKQFPNLSLFIIGEGNKKGEIIKEITKLNLNKHINLLGSINQKDLPKYYSSSDVLVVPSILTKSGDTEGLGIVILEAMASKIAVVASNVGGIPDLIKDRKTGMLVEEKSPADIAKAISEIFSNEDLRSEIVKNSYSFVINNFSWSTVGTKFIKIMK